MLRSLPFLAVALLLLLSSRLEAAEPPGQVAVSPALYELQLADAPLVRSIRLKNLKSHPVAMKVSVFNWSLDESNRLKLLPPDEQSLDSWMLINPLAFTLQPGQTQVVRFSIRPRVKPAEGEHRAIIYFDEQPRSSDAEGVAVLFRLGVGIYAHVGQAIRNSVLHSLQLDRQRREIVAVLENRGNVHARMEGAYAIWKRGAFSGFDAMQRALAADSAKVSIPGFIAGGSINNVPLLPGTRRRIVTPLFPGNTTGEYVVSVDLTIDGTRVQRLLQ